GSPSPAELNAYLAGILTGYADGMRVIADGNRLSLRQTAATITTPPGMAGLRTLRVESDWIADFPRGAVQSVRMLRFENENYLDRIGWRELVITAAAGISVFDSSASGTSASDELRAYPEESLAAPLDERYATFSVASGAAPTGSAPLRARDGQPIAQPIVQPMVPARDRLAELISIKRLTPGLAALGLLIATALGAAHALSPGHGKTVVGAYLVGTRGTPRHALFLGVTVTLTHTLGVFALGLVTLFASSYVLPERLFPVLSFVSGAIVVAVGASLFVRRLGAATGWWEAAHSHEGMVAADDGSGTDPALYHSHGGVAHSHLPPGADGAPVTWRNLLALGISGGILPCPSALVVLLAAVALHRVAYGLLLVLAFSIGLAATLTTVGLVFVYAARLFKRPSRFGRLAQIVPVFSSFVITCLGAGICYEAITKSQLLMHHAAPIAPPGAVSIASILLLGTALGLKHAVEADHLAAVTTMVSQRSSLFASALVGGLWGIGHTISLLLAGVVVILLHVRISETTAMALEMGVAFMLIGMGINAIVKLKRGGQIHLHPHRHGALAHAHLHLHDGLPEAEPRTHHGLRLSPRPMLVGMVHGLAGSAALMLLVLTTIPSPLVGFAYIAVFGIGTIAGMMFMSALVGLPVHLTADRFARANFAVRGAAGLFSLCFGLFMVYQIGFVDGLFN
ncbi:MAG: sulfite exporter TauE/SafE family protein, partial [Lautropia sp.]|nr:sulfite exporter TauE/SafE family protein [Lautropia sp.]